MGKLSQLALNNSPALTDQVISVKTPSGTPQDVNITIQSLLALLAGGGTELSSLIQTYTPSISGQIGGTWSGAVGYYIDLGGIKLCWGTVNFAATATTGHVTLSTPPNSFFSSIQIGCPFVQQEGGSAYQTASGDTFTTSNIPFYINNTANSSSCTAGWFIIGS